MKNKSFCIADRFIRRNYYYMNLLFFILFSCGVVHTGGKNLLFNSLDKLILGVYFCKHEYECLDQTFSLGA